MNVWVRKTRKRSKCFYCGKYLEVGEWQIVCQYFMPTKVRVWTKRMIFHIRRPNCYLNRAIAEIEKNPPIESRGRKRDLISDDSKLARGKILRRHASILQRLRAEMEDGRRADKILHLTELLEKLAGEIEPYGGIPKGW